ncbi:hypothetical protein MKW92_022463 [Papaver armeniacum]|nr:hypothetical protein MKW92_022463 [Papaver armeniacum]
MSGLTTTEKRLIDDNSLCWVTINGKGYYVGKYYESKKKDKQRMKELLQAVRKLGLEGDPGGNAGKSAKNINARQTSIPRPFWTNLFGLIFWLSAGILTEAPVAEQTYDKGGKLTTQFSWLPSPYCGKFFKYGSFSLWLSPRLEKISS